ncbi:hypothetical protein [Morganella morganii]
MMTAIIAEIPEAIRQKIDQSVTITKYTLLRITKPELTGLLCGFIAALS